MRTVIPALVSLFILSSLPGTPGLATPTASGAQARLEGPAASLARGDDDDKDDEDDDDDDDDDEEFRAIG